MHTQARPGLFIDILHETLSFNSRFDTRDSDKPAMGLDVLTDIPLFALGAPEAKAPLPSNTKPSNVFEGHFDVGSKALGLSLDAKVSSNL